MHNSRSADGIFLTELRLPHKKIRSMLRIAEHQECIPAAKCNGVDFLPAVSLELTFTEFTSVFTLVKSPPRQASNNSRPVSQFWGKLSTTVERLVLESVLTGKLSLVPGLLLHVSGLSENVSTTAERFTPVAIVY